MGLGGWLGGKTLVTRQEDPSLVRSLQHTSVNPALGAQIQTDLAGCWLATLAKMTVRKFKTKAEE